MSWLKNLIDKGKQTVQNAVQNVTTGYGDWINGVQNNIHNTVQNTVQNAGQEFSQGVTDKMQENAPIQMPTSGQAVAPSAPPVSNAPANTPPATSLTSTPQSTTPTTTAPSATTPTTSAPTTGAPEVVTGFDSYEDYLGNNSQNAENIYNNTVSTLDKQNKETLQQIDETLEKGKEYATDVKETTDKALEDQKTEVYKYIEDTLADTLGYNNEAYGKLVEDITGAMEAGKLQAEEAKKHLMLIADEAKNATYGAAERQREEAERQADINRQRAITDANSAYEQNKAGYGANAEALANMGLSGGGYSDWINASAYAQNRSEVQGAKARSDAAKREAKYTEDMTKLEADREYTDKKYQAESDYLYKLGQIDTTYRTNMTEAEQKKLKADQDAKDTAREAKAKADSDYAAGKLKSETEYKGFLYDLEAEAGKNKLETNQKTELGKLEASNDYIKAIMQNEGELAKFKEALKADDEKAQQVQLSMYEKVLKGVSDGTYTAEDAAALANAFEFSQEWKDEIANAAGRKEETESQNSALSIIDLKNKGYITGETSDDEIQDYIDAGLIAEGDLTKVKEERNKMALDKVTGLIDTGDYAYAAEKTDEYLERGFISPEESKKAYFDLTKKECEDGFATTEEIDGAIAEINNRLAQGKLTEKDAEALKQYAYANAGETQNMHMSIYDIDGRNQISFSIGNTSFAMWSTDFWATSKDVPKYTGNILNSIASANGNTNSVMLDGVLYARENTNFSWRKIPYDTNSQALYNAYSQYSGNHTKPSAPKHSN